jgi:hypothetical protein
VCVCVLRLSMASFFVTKNYSNMEIKDSKAIMQVHLHK